MSINPLRKAFHRIGIDVRRHHPETDRFAWLRELGIQSVFDIGANVGQFAKEIREALPDTAIYSFEPLSDCFTALNASRKGDDKFKSFNYALGAKTGSETIHRSTYSPSSSLLDMADAHKELFPHTKESRSETIQVRRLDDVFTEIRPAKPLLIKIDTQGYEAQVIAGGAQALREAVAAFVETSYVELYKGQPLFDEIYEKMKSLGFAYRGALHQKLDPKTGAVIFEDSIFVRR